MELSPKTVRDILARWMDDQIVYDYCAEYGEPGYELATDAATPLVVLGDYWCRCDRVPTPEGESSNLHSREIHHPRLWARLEAQGVQFEWHDEWMVDSERGKAYRCEPDSYSWQPSYVLTEDCEMLTPDDDLDTWVEWAENDPSRCIPATVYTGADLIGAGFVQHNGTFEAGWHPGQDDDPRKVTDTIRRDQGDDVAIVFALDSTGQFDVRFSAYYRETETDDSDLGAYAGDAFGAG